MKTCWAPSAQHSHTPRVRSHPSNASASLPLPHVHSAGLHNCAERTWFCHSHVPVSIVPTCKCSGTCPPPGLTATQCSPTPPNHQLPNQAEPCLSSTPPQQHPASTSRGLGTALPCHTTHVHSRAKPAHDPSASHPAFHDGASTANDSARRAMIVTP